MGHRATLLSLLLVFLSATALLTAQQRGLNPQAGGSIKGHVTDQAGRPVPDVYLTLLRPRSATTANDRRPFSFVSAQLRQFTDRNGDFRFDGIGSGVYFVVAMPTRQPMLANGVPSRTGVGITYFPNTTSVSEAKVVTVDLTQSPSIADITLAAVPLANVEGTVELSDGKAPEGGVMSVSHGDGLFGLGGGQASLPGGGRFRVSQLPPGTYFFQVREGDWSVPTAPGVMPKVSGATVVVDGKDVLDVRVLPIKPVRVRGKLIVHAKEGAAAIAPSSITVAGYPIPSDGNPGPQRSGTVQPDMSFEFLTWPPHGSIQVHVNRLLVQPTAIRINGVDVTEKGIDFVAGTTITGVEVEIK